MKYTTNISLGIKIVGKLYEVLGTKYEVKCAQPAEGRPFPIFKFMAV